MSRVTQAYSAHAALPVNGVRMYGLIDTPSAAQAVLDTEDGRAACFPIFDMEEVFESPHDIGQGDEVVTAKFLMLIAPAWGVEGAWVIAGPAMERLDAYKAALARNPDLRWQVDDPDTATIDNRVRGKILVRPRIIGSDWWYVAEITHEWHFLEDD